MVYGAVIFDLFGTLVRDLGGPSYGDVFRRMAAVLSVSVTDLRQCWSDTYHARNTGGFRSVEANLAHICRELGAEPGDDGVRTAAGIRQDYARSVLMAPRAGGAETLGRLREQNLRIGLISDCGPDVATVWPETSLAPWFDTAVFSCVAGMKKPDPRIFRLAAERLGVSGESCIFVGNGGSDEIAGAHDAGMLPVLVLPEAGADRPFQPPEDVIAFAGRHGAVVSSLEEVLALVE